MKLTPGKLAGMKAVSNDRGVIAAAAMDQRGSLKKALGPNAGDAQLAKMMALARQGIEALVAKQQAVLSGLPLRQ